MKTRLSLILILMFVSLTLYSQDYSDLKRALNKWGGIMTNYTTKMAECSDIEKLSVFCVELADSVSAISPLMKEMAKKYPKILNNEPPPELKGFVDKHMEVTYKFGDMTKGLTKIANDNPEDEKYQSAFGKLNSALYYMLR